MVRSGWIPLLVLLTVAAGASGSLLSPSGLGGTAAGVQETGAELSSTALGLAATVKGSGAESADAARQAVDGLSEGLGDEAAGAQQGAEEEAQEADASAHAAVETARERADQTVRTVLQTAEETILRPAGDQVEALRSDVQTLVGDEETPEREAPETTSSVAQMHVPMPILLAGATMAAAAAAGTLFFWLAGSSGSAGVGGAAGAKAAGMSPELRRALPFASPLFTRFERDTVMGHPKREELYSLIVGEPGLSLQRMCDATGLSRTAVTHHLRLLEHHHVIVSRRVGRSRHYFENGGRYGRDQKEAYAVLQNERSRQVAAFIHSNPGAIQKHVCQALGLQASIAHWHVRRLQEAALVETVRQGRTVSYFPTSGLHQIEAGA